MTTRQRTDGEIRDAIHGFIRIEHDEWALVDSPFLQRLRNIHQLAMTYLVYPGATHKRFEHSLGVMELAGRAFDVLTDRRIADTEILDRYGLDGDELRYWRKVLRMAALCHDIGHLPFSHAAEGTLLPPGTNHENITAELILSGEMEPLWKAMGDDGLKPLDVAKVSVGAARLPESAGARNLGDWENLLHDIIAHDALGVDRIDYLLRDSLHTGVAYGRFDHLRLLDTIRIVRRSSDSDSVVLGLQLGGIHTAEALVLARYFMFMQVYYHRVRAAYDIHLQDFLKEWLPGHLSLPLTDTSWNVMSRLTDVDVLLAIREAAGEPTVAGYADAKRILERGHYRMVYRLTRQDEDRAEDAFEQYRSALQSEFGEDNVREWSARQSGRADRRFPVLTPDGDIRSAQEILERLPTPEASFLFTPLDRVSQAREVVRRYQLEV